MLLLCFAASDLGNASFRVNAVVEMKILKNEFSSIEEKVSASKNLNIKSELEYLFRIASYSLDVMLDPISARNILFIAKERMKKLTD